MLDILETLTQDIVVTPFQNERALDVHVLKNRSHITLEEDYRIAIQKAMSDGVDTVITGSLYFISEVRAYILNIMEKEEGMT